jgi:hypothetical protein
MSLRKHFSNATSVFNFAAMENHHPGPLKILHVLFRDHLPCNMLRNREEVFCLTFWTTTWRTEKEERNPQERIICKLLQLLHIILRIKWTENYLMATQCPNVGIILICFACGRQNFLTTCTIYRTYNLVLHITLMQMLVVGKMGNHWAGRRKSMMGMQFYHLYRRVRPITRHEDKVGE